MNPRTSPVCMARSSGDGSWFLTVLMTSLTTTDVSMTTMKTSPSRVSAFQEDDSSGDTSLLPGRKLLIGGRGGGGVGAAMPERYALHKPGHDQLSAALPPDGRWCS
jgi:hypothetical protein